MFGFGKKFRRFIVEEKDVTTVLGVANQNRRAFDYNIGSCSWGDLGDRWFIFFYATDKVYASIIRNLKEIGDFHIEVRGSGEVDMVFRRGS